MGKLSSTAAGTRPERQHPTSGQPASPHPPRKKGTAAITAVRNGVHWARWHGSRVMLAATWVERGWKSRARASIDQWRPPPPFHSGRAPVSRAGVREGPSQGTDWWPGTCARGDHLRRRHGTPSTHCTPTTRVAGRPEKGSPDNHQTWAVSQQLVHRPVGSPACGWH